MRLWSLHPQYLDQKGLVALWREGLLAKAVLENQTKGYKNHSQLDRFKASISPSEQINRYLRVVQKEATRRGYNFNINKLNPNLTLIQPLTVTEGQVFYEWNHLMLKLSDRDPNLWLKFCEIAEDPNFIPIVHPMFQIIPGDVEKWEKVY